MSFNANLALVVMLVVGMFGGTSPALGQALWQDLDLGPHVVGFRVSQVDDRNRVANDGGAGPRSITVATWYPARVGTETMTLGKYARALAIPKENDEFAALAQLSVGEEPGLDIDRYRRLAERQTMAYWEPPAATFTSPIILLAPGLHYESPAHLALLAEYLCSHGYTVVATPLTGGKSQLARLSSDDLESFVADLLVTRATLEPQHVQYAVVGFDLGGIAGFQIARRDSRVVALVSLESGIAAPSLMSRLVAPTSAVSKAALLHVTRPREELEQRGLEEDFSAVDAAISGRTVLRLPHFRHIDFTLAGLLENVDPEFWGPLSGRPQEIVPSLFRVVRQHIDHMMREGPAAGQAGLPEDVTLETTPGDPRISFDEFVVRLLEGAVLERPRGISTQAMQRLADEVISRRQRPELALKAAPYLDASPYTANADELRGDAYLALGKPADAIDAFQRAAHTDPSTRLNAKIEAARSATQTR